MMKRIVVAMISVDGVNYAEAPTKAADDGAPFQRRMSRKAMNNPTHGESLTRILRRGGKRGRI